MFLTAAAMAFGLGSLSHCDASIVYTRSRAVTGGSAWSHVAGISSNGTVRSIGLHGTFNSDVDTRDGRSRYSQKLGAQSSTAVFDGQTYWRQDYSRGVHALDSPNARGAAITAAYLNRNGYFTPSPRDSLTCLGTREERGRTFFVIRVQPRGGLAVEQWIDAVTYLVDRIVETRPTNQAETHISDYRTVGPLVLPFEIHREVFGDPADASTLNFTSYRLRSTTSNETYRRPPYPTDTRFLAPGSSIAHFTIERGSIIVYVRINNKVSLPFLLDTGGHAILTPEAARLLGLTTSGSGSSGGAGSGRVGLTYTFVRELKIGSVLIPNQPFLVIPYGNDFSDRGSKPRLAGILGLELFERLSIRIDYGHGTMTLSPPGASSEPGVREPIVFQDDMPIMMGSADGTGGWFGVDTGNGGSPIMFGPFLKAHGFLTRYAKGAAATGSGTGGEVHLFSETLDQLKIADRSFPDILTYFVVGQHGGSFSSTTEAGNIGYQVLGTFIPTFDYRNGVIIFGSSSIGPVAVRTRVGLSVTKATHDSFQVVGVRPGSPASDAGIAIGDRVTSINGRPASDFGDADYYALSLQPAGVVLRMTIARGTSSRNVRLVLRDKP